MVKINYFCMKTYNNNNTYFCSYLRTTKTPVSIGEKKCV